jgi:anaerobic selenocysteine-containing dehydrogenase
MHPKFFIAAHNKVVEPPGEAKPDCWIFNEIGKRVAPQHWFNTQEEMLDYQLRKGNMTWKEFSQQVWCARTGKEQTYYKYKTDYWKKGGGFPTPTGKLELYSTVIEQLGYDPLPYHKEPGESPYSTPELYKEYPFVLTSGYRAPFYFLSQYRNIPWLRSFMKYPTCQINPKPAKELGIEDGDWVWIESPRGRIMQKVRVYPGIHPKVVMATANCFYPEEPGPFHGLFISNPNVLTDNSHCDEAYGSPDLTALLVKVYKVEQKDLKEIKTNIYAGIEELKGWD